MITDNEIQVPSEEEAMEVQEDTFANIVKSMESSTVTRPHFNLSAVRNANNNNNKATLNTSQANTRNRSAEIPPIVVEDAGNRQKIWNDVCQITDKVTFYPINSNRYRICVTDNLENYQKVLDIVKGAGLKGNTYTPKDIKPISLLVRNLEFVEGLDEEKIKTEYNNCGVSVQKAVQWSTRMMASKKKYFWLLQFHPKTDLTKLKEKLLLFNVAVRYEKPTNKLKIMQCSHCKHFEHAKSSCFNDFRCIKCPDKHEPGQCQLPDTSKPYCCNCKKVDHPANSPNCPAYLKLLSRRKIGTDTPVQQHQNVAKDRDGFTVVGKNGKGLSMPSTSAQSTNQNQVSTSLRYNRFNPNEVNASPMVPAKNPHVKHVYPQQKQQQQQSKSNQPDSLQRRFDALEERIDKLVDAVDALIYGFNSLSNNG